ncbi:uncharacterized protein N7496_003641 [Penicillium cataractarum]|uniref:NACHT domain-containing protein n=1 Tax=Penicillium cataractarum TaxID=2100454 RepID=A0A9W9SMC6_9EURO|nr:uncharacterized protein N7496_003641 [Penicillium cataractarum]KAJ5381213.1 hypothetical protein N7496_003641 [Penicillium cataractarum]
MVLDPFTSLSLACAVCQFLHFSGTLFSKSRKIYKSATGYDEGTDSLLGITNDLHSLTANLKPPIDPNSLTPEETELVNLGDRCKRTANELLLVLNDLQDSNTSRWSSFRAALKTMWKQDRIDEMAKKLESYRLQLILRLTIMQSFNGGNMRIMDELLETNNLLRAGLAPSIQDLRKTVMESMETLRADFERQSKMFMLAQKQEKGENSQPRQQVKWQQEIQQLEALPTVDITAITEKVMTSALASNNMAIQLFVMRSLRFDGMELRRSQVTEAHKRTYSWAYISDFSEWMVSEDPLFWISGKPGSGKSTLMKYLASSPDTSDHLRKWAGTRNLVIIDYFFWINGTDLHRSQEGLLRSLLFDIFRKCPELIETTFPEQWNDSLNLNYDFNELSMPWSRRELLSGLQKITQQTASSNAFCIFIDGLDEYEGEHEDLVNLLSYMAKTSPIKLCVASRPWNIFEKALGKNSTRKLYLENLNRPDIELYVKNQLQDRADFKALALSNPDATELASDIVQRSNGVFLWVYLVVLLVKQGLVNEDRIVDLKRRVSAYPADLNDLFKHIMDSLDTFYQAQIARGFSIALAAKNPLSVVSFWYLDELELDASVAITKQVDYSAEKRGRLKDFWKEEVRKVTARLNGRFKGFLEIVKTGKWETPSELRVDFLHRTVRDFLVTEDCQRVLKEWTPSSFDVHSVLCNIQLAEAKELDPRLADPVHLERLTEGIFYSAQQYEKCHQKSLNTVLEHLDRTIAGYGHVRYPWENLGLPLTDAENFNVSAVLSNMAHFISNRFETDSISEEERLRSLEMIFKVTRTSAAEDLHDLPSSIEVVGNPLDMILLLVETRPLVSRIPFEVVWTGMREYGTATIRSILRCLCRNGLVDLEEFQQQSAAVTILTTPQDAKELEEMTRIAWKGATRSPHPQTQLKQTSRPHIHPPEKTIFNKKKGKLHRWLGKVRSG